jgi:two-component system, OmpR family, response regulator
MTGMAASGQASRQVLIVSGDARDAQTLASAVRRSGRRLDRSTSLDEARRLLCRERYVAVLCQDTVASGNVSSLVSEIRRAGKSTPVIVVSRKDDWGNYMAALAAGATDYLAFPPYPGEVERSLEGAAKFDASLPDVV